MKQIHSTEEMRTLACQGAPAIGCSCHLGAFKGWTSLTDDRWPTAQMQEIAQLRDPALAEPTFEEFHPRGTRYDSADAPIALAYYPVNRANVWRCLRCGIQVMRYTEFGGYYVDHRVRILDPRWVVEAPPPQAV